MAGEGPNDRKAIDGTTQALIKEGFRPEDARKKAVESMKRVDRRLREQGQR